MIGVTPDQCRIGRAAMGLSQQDLAAAAGLPVSEIDALEAGTAVAPATPIAAATALAESGVTFFVAPDGSARLRARTLDGIIEAPVELSRDRTSRS